MAMDLRAADYKELRFLSRKPFPVGKKQLDALNPHLIDSLDSPKAGELMRAKPLRGYLDDEDYKNLQQAKDFLYNEWDLDRIEREVKQAAQKTVPEYYVGPILPGQKQLDAVFKRCHTYQSEIQGVKKDVTYTEQ